MRKKTIKVSREVWDKMRNSVKRVIQDNVEVIEEKGGENDSVRKD